jgi:hypothetical protein
MIRLIHTGLGSSSLIAHVLHSPPPHANSFVIGPAVIKHTHVCPRLKTDPAGPSAMDTVATSGCKTWVDICFEHLCLQGLVDFVFDAILLSQPDMFTHTYVDTTTNYWTLFSFLLRKHFIT